MTHHSAYHQLGRFIVSFQHLEDTINGLLELLADADCETVRILINDLEFSKRLSTIEVLFSHFISIRTGAEAPTKAAFHKLMIELGKLGERRNDIVHSRYNPWTNTEGREGLLRTNSRLRGSKGEREETEEEIQPEAFDADLHRLAAAAEELEKFRLQIIDRLYPPDRY